jgi:hypothetical protein
LLQLDCPNLQTDILKEKHNFSQMAFEDGKPYVETAGFSLLLTLCFPVLLSGELPEAAMVGIPMLKF